MVPGKGGSPEGVTGVEGGERRMNNGHLGGRNRSIDQEYMGSVMRQNRVDKTRTGLREGGL